MTFHILLVASTVNAITKETEEKNIENEDATRHRVNCQSHLPWYTNTKYFEYWNRLLGMILIFNLILKNLLNYKMCGYWILFNIFLFFLRFRSLIAKQKTIRNANFRRDKNWFSEPIESHSYKNLNDTHAGFLQ